MTNKRGFTLVELLVVLAIICILAALIIPAIKQAIDAAKTDPVEKQPPSKVVRTEGVVPFYVDWTSVTEDGRQVAQIVIPPGSYNNLHYNDNERFPELVEVPEGVRLAYGVFYQGSLFKGTYDPDRTPPHDLLDVPTLSQIQGYQGNDHRGFKMLVEWEFSVIERGVLGRNGYKVRFNHGEESIIACRFPLANGATYRASLTFGTPTNPKAVPVVESYDLILAESTKDYDL